MSAIRLSQDYIVYDKKEQPIYPIEEEDWLRLKRMISKIRPSKEIIKSFAIFFFGITVTASFNLILFYFLYDVNFIIYYIFWSIFVVSLILGLGFMYLNKNQIEIERFLAESILEEMEYIEKQFNKGL